MEQPPPVAGAPPGRLCHGSVAARDFWFLARRDDAVWQAPHKEEQRSLQPGSARGHPSQERSLQPGSARGHPSQERSLQPGSARGHPSQERSLQPGSARGAPLARKEPSAGEREGYPSHENHQGPKSAPRPAPSASPVARPRTSTMQQASPVAGAPRTRLFHGSAADTRRFRFDGALAQLGRLIRSLPNSNLPVRAPCAKPGGIVYWHYRCRR